MNRENKMPVIFSGHGSPMNAIGSNKARDGWIRLGKELAARPVQPRVILVVSSHWATKGLFVRRAADNPQINDMYGFPEELYRVHYTPDGSVEYADRVLEALGGTAAVNNDWGIDHGVWSILSNMFPAADIPVVMISTDLNASAKMQFETGRRLQTLRDQGALILASGNVVHNLRLVGWDMDNGYLWADRFDASIRRAIENRSFEIPANFRALPDAEKAVPTPEHYYPLLTALGAAEPEDQVTVWNDYRELGSMSMTSYLFDAAPMHIR